jgi:PAS domain S-box-containing protein
MNAIVPPFSGVVDSEISALIMTLHETERRLETLTAGEVDTVSDRDGRTIVLRRAQDHLRHNVAVKQAAILNALRAHVALLNGEGLIVSVNEAWRHFDNDNALQGSGYEIGENYLEICDRTHGEDSADAHQVAAGIRSVLDGSARNFSIEYPCHTPAEQQWFQLTATPLAAEHPHGAVVMHLDITQQRLAKNELRESKRRFGDMLDNVMLVSLMLDCDARITYCNEYLLRLTGWRHEEVIGKDWFELFVPSDRNDVRESLTALLANQPSAWHGDNEILTRSGERRLIRWNNSVLRSASGDTIGTASIGEDITERKMAEEILAQRTAELELFHRLSVGRELQMIELKRQINGLATQLGHEPPYDLTFLVSIGES